MLSAGTPMLLMGDEVRRTQAGNNNAYTLDNELNWFDWTLLDRHADMLRFVQVLTAFRQRRDAVADGMGLSLNELLSCAHISWHGVQLNQPDWSDHSHSIAFTLQSLRGRFLFHAIFNAYWEPLPFELPPVPDGSRSQWRRCIDTSLPAPDDIREWADAADIAATHYVAHPRSVALLVREAP
jgi:glycogen operon protein